MPKEEIPIPSWIQPYLNDFGDKDGATQKLAGVAREYKEAIDTHYQHIGAKMKNARDWQRMTGEKVVVDPKKERAAIEYAHKMKALEVAREYVKDDAQLNRINPEIQIEVKYDGHAEKVAAIEAQQERDRPMTPSLDELDKQGQAQADFDAREAAAERERRKAEFRENLRKAGKGKDHEHEL